MRKKNSIPKPNEDYLLWHDNLKTGVLANTPGATATDVTMLAADNTALHTKSLAAINSDIASKAAHADFATTLAASRRNARALAQRIKKSTGFTPALGETLQLVGIEDTTDMTQEKPLLKAVVKPGGVVEVEFNKKLATGVHLYIWPARRNRPTWTIGRY